MELEHGDDESFYDLAVIHPLSGLKIAKHNKKPASEPSEGSSPHDLI